MRLKDKAALITGGGRGIGATTAYLFAKEGAKVGIVDIREEGLSEVAAEAKKRGFEFGTFVGDISKKDQVEKVLEEFVQAFGRIDVLVNNAGIAISKPFLEKTALELDHRPGYFQQCILALLDCINNPLSRTDVVLQKLFRFFAANCVFCHFRIVFIYSQAG